MNIDITSGDINICLEKSNISSVKVDVHQAKRGFHNLATQIINLLTVIIYQWSYNLQSSH